jgi:NitT/TauT family transport system substrate-binding protein
MRMSVEARTLRKPIAYERYVDESFVHNVAPVRIAL